ncbi:GPA1 heterotrimeric G-protein alpha subunit [Mycena latifolia]|nr:GPA1 heterotrimeric G-protein alpha subunit [Mycena latifolia]
MYGSREHLESVSRNRVSHILSLDGGKPKKQSNAQRDAYKETIYSNTLQSMQAVLGGMVALGISLAPQNSAHRKTILSHSSQIKAESLPHDPLVRFVPLFIDSAVYYFDSINRMAAPGYIPTDQDILRSCANTTGILEATFEISGLTYKLFDVGGLRNQRKNMSDYDRMLYENLIVNRMHEALTLFDSICNSRWFVNTSILPILNQLDLNCFPDYGGDNYDKACDYLLYQFISL